MSRSRFPSPRLERVAVFTHESLDFTQPTIRVIRVLTGPKKSTLQCTIEHVPLDGRHTCLSYTWGSPDRGYPILLNGKIFKVRQNLHNFLLQARADGVSDTLWIDAVCIDQQNIAERNHQVQQMAQIYQQARRVLIWLGKGRGEADIVLGITQLLAHHASARNKDAYDCFRSSISQANPRFWKYAAKLDSSPYFKRLWIVQEIYLSREAILIHGKTWCRWEYYLWLPKAASRWRRNRSFNTQVPRFFLAYALQRIDNDGKAEVGELIRYFGAFGCADPRDRLYALLSMTKGGDSFPVDYESDLLVLYLRACQHWPVLRERVWDKMELYDALGAKVTSLKINAVSQRYPDLVSQPLRAFYLFDIGLKHSSEKNSCCVWVPVAVEKEVTPADFLSLQICNSCEQRIRKSDDYFWAGSSALLQWDSFYPAGDEVYMHSERINGNDLDRACFTLLSTTSGMTQSHRVLELYRTPRVSTVAHRDISYAPADHHWILSRDNKELDPPTKEIFLALLMPCNSSGCFFRDRRQNAKLVSGLTLEPFNVLGQAGDSRIPMHNVTRPSMTMLGKTRALQDAVVLATS